MRRFTVAIAAALLMCAAPAYAQAVGAVGTPLSKGGRMGKGLPDEKDARSPEQKKKDEAAYKDAVERISPNGKFDPWGKVRATPPSAAK